MSVADRLLGELGPDIVSTGAQIPDRNRADWSGLPAVLPLALVRPRTTAQVATALRICNETATPVVTQGGLSGLCGGAHPVEQGLALSLERMNRVIGVDVAQATLTAEAGCILQVAQQAAADQGMMLAVDLGARGSCTVGGVIGTNAGGNQVLRYGMTRDHVLGLEAVLADGTVLPAMNRLLKNNVGLDLKQMFIGTEGTMGVVTQAVFRLHPRPTSGATAFVGVADSAAMLALLSTARKALGPALISFEVMWPSFYDIMRAGSGAAHPLAGQHGVYIVIEAGGFDPSVRERLETTLGDAMEAGIIEDAVIAGNLREERALWAVRESVSEYPRIIGKLTPFDIGIPLDRMAEAVATLEAAITARWPDARALSYGHMGDSNLHLVVNVPSAGDDQPSKEIKALVYGLTREYAGTVSAEHGIGIIKRDVIGYSRSPEELAAMRAVKAALDPRGILNPGKAFA
ncbi:FAD-binding oxidoreductase [Gemmobacter sp.]|uniref:FAD-binding oxidoreductase n=1 Tax=Gemmobacter sp. TaxID=1898957 RepID=UPI002AFF8E1F|nr:FAD-binding oxidoreductase [Gemmobacter sp.]